MPGFIKPQLATLKSKAPKGEQWLHEIKFDGYRIQVHINSGRKKVYTRNGLDWTKRFSTIAGALDIPGQAIIDGEVVVTHEGRTNFVVVGEQRRRRGEAEPLHGLEIGSPTPLIRRLLNGQVHPYETSLARRRPYSALVIDPDFFSWSSLVISSATLKPTTCRNSSRAC